MAINPFILSSINPLTGLNRSTTYESDICVGTGYTGNATLSGHINCVAASAGATGGFSSFTTGSRTIPVNGRFKIRVTTPGTYSTSVTASINLSKSNAIATDTWTLTTMADPGSSSGGASGGTANYGIQVLGNVSGLDVFSPNLRAATLQTSGTVSVASGVTTGLIAVEDMTATNGADIGVMVLADRVIFGNSTISYTRTAGGFTITNSMNQTVTVRYYALRY